MLKIEEEKCHIPDTWSMQYKKKDINCFVSGSESPLKKNAESDPATPNGGKKYWHISLIIFCYNYEKLF